MNVWWGAVAAMVVVVAGCGGSDGEQETAASKPSAGCAAGEPVGTPKGDDAPSCVDAGPAAGALSYGCYPNGAKGDQRGSFFVVNYEKRSLYGKAGGTWVQGADPDVLDRAAIRKIGCG